MSETVDVHGVGLVDVDAVVDTAQAILYDAVADSDDAIVGYHGMVAVDIYGVELPQYVLECVAGRDSLLCCGAVAQRATGRYTQQ